MTTYFAHLISSARRAGTARWAALSRGDLAALLFDDEGMTTIEYAMGTLAAAALAGVLYAVITSGGVSSAIEGIINDALSNIPS